MVPPACRLQICGDKLPQHRVRSVLPNSAKAIVDLHIIRRCGSGCGVHQRQNRKEAVGRRGRRRESKACRKPLLARRHVRNFAVTRPRRVSTRYLSDGNPLARQMDSPRFRSKNEQSRRGTKHTASSRTTPATQRSLDANNGSRPSTMGPALSSEFR